MLYWCRVLTENIQPPEISTYCMSFGISIRHEILEFYNLSFFQALEQPLLWREFRLRPFRRSRRGMSMMTAASTVVKLLDLKSCRELVPLMATRHWRVLVCTGNFSSELQTLKGTLQKRGTTSACHAVFSEELLLNSETSTVFSVKVFW